MFTPGLAIFFLASILRLSNVRGGLPYEGERHLKFVPSP
jgi:hypothetical protein